MLPENLLNSAFGQRSKGAFTRFQNVFRPNALRAPRHMAPRIIEIIGLSGSGKTSFLAQIKRGRRSPSFWATKQEFFDLEGRRSIRQCEADDRLLLLLQDRMDAIRLNGEQGSRLFRRFYNTFNSCFDAVFLENADLFCHIIEDEGFVFTFRNEILERSSTDEGFFGELTRRRAFVAILCEPRLAVENLRKRAAGGGKVLDGHQGFDEARMMQWAEDDARGIDRLLHLARKAGMPVLELETRGDFSSNLAKFERMFD
jgi:hypothetical protein